MPTRQKNTLAHSYCRSWHVEVCSHWKPAYYFWPSGDAVLTTQTLSPTAVKTSSSSFIIVYKNEHRHIPVINKSVTRRSAVAEGPRDALYQLKSCQLLQSCTKIAFEKVYNRWMTLKATQGHWKWYVSVAVCSNNASFLHRFRDITTFTVYVIACDLEKFSFDKS